MAEPSIFDALPDFLSKAFLCFVVLFDLTLQLPPGTLLKVMAGDDWSFVIRAHALIEGLVSVLLASSLDKRLSPIFDKLELGQEETGKLAFAKALSLVEPGPRQFIRLLSQIRNKLAHNPKFLSFTIDSYFGSLDKNQKVTFVAALMAECNEENRAAWQTLIDRSPKEAFVARTVITLGALFSKAFKTELLEIPVPPELESAFSEFLKGRDPLVDGHGV